MLILLGGITKVRRFNPSEFAWRFSSLFQAECYLMTAPAVVDSPQTRQTLIESPPRLAVDIEVKTDDKGVETSDVKLDIQPLPKKEGKARPEPEEVSSSE